MSKKTATLDDLLYITNGCCENAHGNEEYFKQLRLKYGYYDSNFKLKDVPPSGRIPRGGSFYPLTPYEAQFIAEETGPVEYGYSVLFRGEKWLAPQTFVPKKEAKAICEHADKVCQTQGGFAFTAEGKYSRYDLDTKNYEKLIIAMIPFYAVSHRTPERHREIVEIAFNQTNVLKV